MAQRTDNQVPLERSRGNVSTPAPTAVDARHRRVVHVLDATKRATVCGLPWPFASAVEAAEARAAGVDVPLVAAGGRVGCAACRKDAVQVAKHSFHPVRP